MQVYSEGSPIAGSGTSSRVSVAGLAAFDELLVPEPRSLPGGLDGPDPPSWGVVAGGGRGTGTPRCQEVLRGEVAWAGWREPEKRKEASRDQLRVRIGNEGLCRLPAFGFLAMATPASLVPLSL